MDIIVSGRHLQLTEALKDSVHSQLENMRVSYPKLTKADVILSDMGHDSFKAEIILHGNKINLDAHAETGDMYESISVAVTRLERQLEKKLETFHNNHKARHLGEVEKETEDALAELADVD